MLRLRLRLRQRLMLCDSDSETASGWGLHDCLVGCLPQQTANCNRIEQYTNYERDLQFSSRTMGSAAAGHSIRISNSSSRNNFLTYAECLTVVQSPPEINHNHNHSHSHWPLNRTVQHPKQSEQQNVGGMHFKAVKVQEPNICAVHCARSDLL